MKDNIFDEILRQREKQNEKIVAIARFSLFSFACILDLLAFFQIISYTSIAPEGLTIALDFVFIFFSGLILFFILNTPYRSYFKFITITFDYLFIGIFLYFDPTIPKHGESLQWISLIASIFIYTYNLIRFSKIGTIYSAILSELFVISFVFLSKEGKSTDTIPMLIGLFMILLLGYYITITNAKMLREANTKKMMERFLPPQLIEELYKQADNLATTGKYQKVTILFSDIRSFTELSESLHATEVVSFLNDYLSTMTEIIFQYQGTIDKFIGDAIMTIYGAPLVSNQDEERAIQTALAMQKALIILNQKYKNFKSPLQIGIGLHTGDVIVGNIGSEKRLDYTVIGDNVNLASRIESLTKYYHCPILISETTLLGIENSPLNDSLLVREIDTVQVKGKSASIKIYEIICDTQDENLERHKQFKKKFETGLELYKSKKFSEALPYFDSATDRASQLYSKRCQEFLVNPPSADWAGIYVFDTK